MNSDLYISNTVQYYDGMPFQKVNKLKVDEEGVHFSTEWPVRELCCTPEDWDKLFRKWK